MNFREKGAEIYVPDGMEISAALARTTYLGVAAHPDDLEIMAIDGILRAFGRDDHWFCGAVVTDGSGSPRENLYKDYSDAQMCQARRREQKKAAQIGEYGALVLLDYPSSSVKDGANLSLERDLLLLLKATRPDIVYTHNLADKHDTHVAVALRLIAACRKLPPSQRPSFLCGCEVWRDLDWLRDQDKVVLDTSAHPNLQASLLGVFDSQISGGKRYDLATLGRRTAHATFFESHQTDQARGLVFAMDLTPLVYKPGLAIEDFIEEQIDLFKQEVIDRIRRMKTRASRSRPRGRQR